MSHGSIDDILARIARLEQGSGEKPAPRSSEPEPEPKGDQEAARDPAGFQTIEPDEAVNDSAEDDAEILSSDTFRDDADLDHDEDAEFESSAEQDRDAVFGTITPDADLDEPEPSAPKHPESGLHAPVFKIGKQGFEEMNLARPMARKGSVERADASVNEQDAEPEQAATEQKNKPEPAKKPSSGSDGVVSVGTGFASRQGHERPVRAGQ